jgi:hypothetical protein
MLDNRNRTFDNLCVLQAENKGTITASAAGVDSSNVAAVFNTGGGFTKGDWVVDVHFCASASSKDAVYLALQGSTVSTFSTKQELARMYFGNLTRTSFNAAAKTTGRFIKPFSNQYGDVVYQYLRVYCQGLGTFATGIDYASFLSK